MTPSDFFLRYALLLALLLSAEMRLTTLDHGFASNSDAFSFLCRFVEFFAAMAPGVLLGMFTRRKALQVTATLMIAVVPFIIILNAFARHLLGDGLFSETSWRALLAGPLWWGDVGPSSIRFAVTLFLGTLTMVAISLPIARGRRRKQTDEVNPSIIFRITIAIAAVGVFSAVVIRQHAHEAGGVETRRGVHEPQQLQNSPAIGLAGDPGPPSSKALVGGIGSLRWLTANPISAERSPDLALVILESFRHELITSKTMPALHDAAQHGIWFQNHFSSGNATNHGIFSLFNGMNATHFGNRERRFDPLLPRLFRQAGYEVGFFSGDHDWAVFKMEGIVNREHFDCYGISSGGRDAAKSLAADREAVESTLAFLDDEDIRLSRQSSPSRRPPRLAILYLYATHAPYRSYPRDHLFQPSAPDDFLIPYAKRDVAAVWNRYRNAAHTVDRWLAVILSGTTTTVEKPLAGMDGTRSVRERIVMVTGDHGESFMEDGLMLHGTGISVVQNSTPLVICGAPSRLPKGMEGTEVTRLTYHPDILPTLLGLSGIKLNLYRSQATKSPLDGSDLLSASGIKQLRNPKAHETDTDSSRQVITRDYLSGKVWRVPNDYRRQDVLPSAKN